MKLEEGEEEEEEEEQQLQRQDSKGPADKRRSVD